MVRVDQTPNPDAMKFTVGSEVTDGSSVTYRSIEDAADSPWAREILSGGGIASVFAVSDFVTVTRDPGLDWGEIVDRVVATLDQHFG